MHDVNVVLMAGGSGERFWPYSRQEKPKQFLQVAGKGTLLQQAVERAKLLCPVGGIYIVTGQRYLNLVKEQVPEIAPMNLIVEPVGRDTAPCIALAATYLEAMGFHGVMVVLPSDHMVTDYTRFAHTLKTAIALAGEREALVTIGIRPTRPETGYGYIRIGDKELAKEIFKVADFTEKPDAKCAMAFLSSGKYLWNSGIFVWQLPVIKTALEKYLPELMTALAPICKAIGTPDFESILAECFPALPRISIDYGVMEKADNVWVVPGDFGWDDLGTWTALERVGERDENKNLVHGSAVMVDTETSIVHNDNPNKMVVTFGLRDALVVDTEDVLLVADKNRAPELKRLLDELRRQGLDRYLQRLAARGGQKLSNENIAGLEYLMRDHNVHKKPWGYEIWWAVNERYAGKVLYIRSGEALSRQYHREKSETMLFLKGEGILELGEETISISPPMAVDIPAGTVHRIRACKDVVLIEVSTPELDDVVRLADNYGRLAGAR
ncbi:mannose-1-phosphate guanylyltransferase [Moorella naiadis]|uniref:mannose-1-phosphate guanylyltransferase n=1 Tax=Moorella naiadis (nom. illeg.) TaxID=3093670 RepID=UPI003D9C9A06